MMNQEQIKGKIQQVKGIAQQEWSKLKDEDFQEGSMERLAGRITELYGITKAEAQKKLDELMDTLGDAVDGSSGNKVADSMHKMGDKISEYAEQGHKKLEEAADGIKHQSQEWYDYMDKCVKEKPLATLAIALGVGALIGSIISR